MKVEEIFRLHPSPLNAMSEFVKVAKVSEVLPNSLLAVEINGQRLLLVNLGQEFYAIDALCPHRNGPLEKGHLYENEGIIECPWHYYRYDVRTGKNLYPRNVYPADLTYLERDLKPLQHYRVRVEGDEILVEFHGDRKE
ncbi:ferredoxin subunit of nitrite reductase and ring-hydroxylating dioxygenase [Pleurocapsa sp. PCC 7327]|nr:ferredoxin subunit of nitrite reductase and ring-hydroxylating dioxygenase [Pleurocapsa sp. PCC 7327]